MQNRNTVGEENQRKYHPARHGTESPAYRHSAPGAGRDSPGATAAVQVTPAEVRTLLEASLPDPLN